MRTHPPRLSSSGGAERRPEDPGAALGGVRGPTVSAAAPGSPDRRAARLSGDDSGRGGAGVVGPWPDAEASPSLVILGRSAAETRGPRRRAREAGRAASGGVRTQARFAEQVAMAAVDTGRASVREKGGQ